MNTENEKGCESSMNEKVLTFDSWYINQSKLDYFSVCKAWNARQPEIDSLKNTIEELEKECAQRLSVIEHYRLENEGLEKEASELIKRNQNLLDSYYSKTTECKKLCEENERLKKENEGMKEKIFELQNDIAYIPE